ncbi:unnamed protein product [Ectocarpus fasciculatus]
MASIYRTVGPVASARRCISSAALRSQRSYGSSAALVSQRPPAVTAGALLRSSVATAGPPEGVTQLQPGHRRFGASSALGAFRGSSPRRDEHIMELPGLGDSISEGTVVEWRKSVGDKVSEDEVVAVVETDKVSVDVRSTHVGVVVKLFAAVDDVVEVGKPLCTIDGDEASVVKARVQAQQDEEDANAPPPTVPGGDPSCCCCCAAVVVVVVVVFCCWCCCFSPGCRTPSHHLVMSLVTAVLFVGSRYGGPVDLQIIPKISPGTFWPLISVLDVCHCHRRRHRQQLSLSYVVVAASAIVAPLTVSPSLLLLFAVPSPCLCIL